MESSSSNSSNSTGADQGTSNPNPAPYSPPPPTRQLLNEGSPLRRSSGGGGGANLGAGQLRLAAVSSLPPPRAIRPLATVPPVMGVPGVSAFSPYNRPPPPPASAAPTTGAGPGPTGGIPGLPSFLLYNRAPPRPDWYPVAGSSSSASGLGFGSGFGFFSSHVAEAGGSGQGSVAPIEGGALRIGGSPAARKRGREEGEASGAGRQQGEAAPYQVPCPICARDFMSDKALFGHMRSHPNRGWKGVHPPPAFRAEEEFADVPGLNRPEGMAADGGEGGEAAEAAAAEGGGEAEMQAQGGAEENFNVPDLNMPPPPSPDQ